MGIDVVLQNEKCEDISTVIYDPDGMIVLCTPPFADESYCCVRFIDPYGDTVFNQIQAVVMLDEWDRLKSAFVKHSTEAHWSDIRELIIRCTEEPHTYIRFMGD